MAARYLTVLDTHQRSWLQRSSSFPSRTQHLYSCIDVFCETLIKHGVTGEILVGYHCFEYWNWSEFEFQCPTCQLHIFSTPKKEFPSGTRSMLVHVPTWVKMYQHGPECTNMGRPLLVHVPTWGLLPHASPGVGTNFDRSIRLSSQDYRFRRRRRLYLDVSSYVHYCLNQWYKKL